MSQRQGADTNAGHRPNPLKTLLIAIGNPYRRDDGAARKVVRALELPPDARLEVCLQLTPELAAEMVAVDRTIFVDADATGVHPALETISESAVKPSPIGHALSPEEVVAMARGLFGYQGEAWLCRIPGEDFSDGEGLSAKAAANADVAVDLLASFTGFARKNRIEKRKERRLLCADLVHLSWTGEDGIPHEEIANLEDISGHGLCLQVEQPVPVGVRVAVAAGETVMHGHVRYCREELFGWFCGIQLDEGSEWPKERYQPKHLLDPESLSGRRKS